MTISKKKKLLFTICLIIGSFIAAHLCFILLPNVFETWNAQTVDELFVLRSSIKELQPQYDSTIAHVDLNNSSLRKVKSPYVHRSQFAQVIRNLAAMNASAQVFDFVFAAPIEENGDEALIEATETAGNVYFGLAMELRENNVPPIRASKDPESARYLDKTKWDVAVKGDPYGFYVCGDTLLTFLKLASVSRGLGSLSVKFDRDGVLRRVPLLVRYEDAFYPSLYFRVICDYLGVPPEKIIVEPGKRITLRDIKKPGETVPHDIRIPIDRYGNMIISYIGPWERMDHYNFADILLASEDREELEMWREELRGKILVVSDVSTGSTDLGPVPTDANYPLSGVHANVMHGILTESFLRELSKLEMLMVELSLLMIVLLLSLRSSSYYFSFGIILVSASYMGLFAAAFFYGHLIFHIIRPLLMMAFATISILIYRYVTEEKEKLEGFRQRDFVRATFGRYLSSEVVDELLDSPHGLKMSGETREITILVSDLRGFTSLSSSLSPSELIPIINRYFEAMTNVISRYRGTVDELQGDGILVFFGAPLSSFDHPERAVACAIEMQNKMVEVNAAQRRESLPELAMGIGINTGEVVVGNIGSKNRLKYGAVGTAINLAYRIESCTKGGQLLISPTTYQKVKSFVHIRNNMKREFKGIKDPMTIYDVDGIEGKYQLSLL